MLLEAPKAELEVDTSIASLLIPKEDIMSLLLLDATNTLACLLLNSNHSVAISSLRNFRLVRDAPRFLERPFEKDQHGRFRLPP